jgi:cell division inhibitor SepF
VEHHQEYEAQVTPLRPTRVASTPQHEAHAAGELRRITTIHPRSYNDARKIGEAFREGTPVIMNLTDMDDADAKRLVDFSAGLIFGLHGAIERVTAKVFLLSPSHVEVSGEPPAAEPTTRAGFFNQS